MKKTIVRMLLLLLALLLLAGAAQAEENLWSFDVSDACLELNDELAENLSGAVTVPEVVDDAYVTAIKFATFQNLHGITSLELPVSLRALQSYAISYMDGLEELYLPEGLQVIDDGNICSCNALEKVVVPASVRCINSAFIWCENLREIVFEGVCPVFVNADDCFSGLAADCVIYVPDDQYDAYAAALAECYVEIRPSGSDAQPAPDAMTEDYFEFDPASGTITRYLGMDAVVELPASIGGVPVKAIGEEAFAWDYYPYVVLIPEGVEEICDSAFYQASNLIHAEFPASLRRIGIEAFNNAQLSSVRWGEGLEEIGDRAFAYHGEYIMQLPSSLRVIGEGAFECAGCAELYLGGALEKIGSRAFAESGLYYMAFDLYEPIEIAPDAFADTWLYDLDLPWDSSVENRDAYAEMLAEQCPDCTVWINNPISAGVADYPENEPEITAFENGVWTVYNGNAADLTVWSDYDEEPVTALGEGLFRGNRSIRSFYPHHCGWFTTIGDEAFAGSSVEYVEFFPSITEIGKGAFRDCDCLTELVIPASIGSVGEDALAGCVNLKRLVIECDPIALPENLLAGCPADMELYAAADASDETLEILSAMANRPWNRPVTRIGESLPELAAMPYEPLPGADFWYDAEFARLDRYEGYARNLILPREIDGTALSMIGGGMMARASYGDNFEIELPVRSLVIPENYTEIPGWAFANCESLETVICYAPIEHLEDAVFAGCTSLREVVFVNGVGSIGAHVFDGCTALETLYLGSYVQQIDERAFLNSDGSAAVDPAVCIYDPAQMPDVDALLAAVKCDPMPTPEPTATPAPAMPIGEAGTAFFGSWRADTLEMGGAEYPASEMGLDMEFTLYEDGRAVSIEDGEAYEAVWTLADGVADLDGLAVRALEDGRLCAEEEELKLYFVRTGDAVPAAVPAASAEIPAPEPAVAPAEAPAAAGDDRLDCKYVCINADVSGYVVDASMLGGEFSVVFHGDGSVEFTMANAAVPGLSWTQGEQDGMPARTVDYYGTPMVFVQTDAGYDLNYFDSMLMHFVPEA